MTKEILKGSMVIMLVVGVSFLAAAITANGQVSDGRFVADIPFDFVVGNESLSAGKYTARRITNGPEALLISNVDTKKAAVRLTNDAERSGHDTTAKMVFHRYGKNYFLAEVWYAGRSDGRILRMSSQERAIGRELAATKGSSDLAANSYERVEIVALAR